MRDAHLTRTGEARRKAMKLCSGAVVRSGFSWIGPERCDGGTDPRLRGGALELHHPSQTDGGFSAYGSSVSNLLRLSKKRLDHRFQSARV